MPNSPSVDVQRRPQVQTQGIGGVPAQSTVQRQADHLTRHGLQDPLHRAEGGDED